MPSLMEQLDTLLTAAALAEEGLPEAALELMAAGQDQDPSPAWAAMPPPREALPQPH